ncbi:jg23408, partial [Pararge aegeria aegeria]
MQRGFAIRALSSFRTVSVFYLKVREVCLIENTGLTGLTEYLPDDISLERPTPPRLMLHPAKRLTFPAQFLVSQDEV